MPDNNPEIKQQSSGMGGVKTQEAKESKMMGKAPSGEIKVINDPNLDTRTVDQLRHDYVWDRNPSRRRAVLQRLVERKYMEPDRAEALSQEHFGTPLYDANVYAARENEARRKVKATQDEADVAKNLGIDPVKFAKKRRGVK
jgi:hypothetical protein